ncbi:2945_t:CDS:2 [Diversispora eburnea]|uniref:2945_t:CDS:1 n=1 Tax=Diversispora eburnea TaxID=1213867 RepID=A0A9N8V273_9GLOM|nr:2945_t:CDS:2 [Diversispora eburnea]
MSAPKIGYLLVRTLAKPLANGIKNYSKTHPTFKKWCINLAQKTYKLEMNLNMYLLGQKHHKIRSLNDAK